MRFNKFSILTLTTLTCLWFGCSDSPAENQQKETANNEVRKQATEATADRKVILFFGNSLTAGYGVEAHESFPAMLQARIDSLGLPYEVVNAGISGETTAAGLNRIDWVLEKQQVDIFVLELGANDGLRGLNPTQTKENLQKIIDRVRDANAETEIILAGMMVPPSMGPEYGAKYNRIFPELAQSEDVHFIPFLLENVGGIDSLNQADGIHPNPSGNKIVTENVWKVLQPMLTTEY